MFVDWILGTVICGYALAIHIRKFFAIKSLDQEQEAEGKLIF